MGPGNEVIPLQCSKRELKSTVNYFRNIGVSYVIFFVIIMLKHQCNLYYQYIYMYIFGASLSEPYSSDVNDDFM